MDVRVYRPTRDWKNQRPSDLEDSYIGDITGLVMGGPSVQPVRQFPGTVSTEGQLGVPFAQDSEILVQEHDILVVDETKFAVTSGRFWTGENVLTGTPPTYYFVDVESST